MFKQASISLGILLVFGCADDPNVSRQLGFDSGGCGCNECPEINSESSAGKNAFFDSTNFDTSNFQD